MAGKTRSIIQHLYIYIYIFDGVFRNCLNGFKLISAIGGNQLNYFKFFFFCFEMSNWWRVSRIPDACLSQSEPSWRRIFWCADLMIFIREIHWLKLGGASSAAAATIRQSLIVKIKKIKSGIIYIVLKLGGWINWIKLLQSVIKKKSGRLFYLLGDLSRQSWALRWKSRFILRH